MKKKRQHSRLVRKWDGRTVDENGRMPRSGKRPSLRSLRTRLEKCPEDIGTRIALAERIMQRKNADEAITLLEPSVPNAPKSGADADTLKATRVLMFAYAKAERFDDARNLATAVLRIHPQALDCHYLLAYIGYRMGREASCEEHANAFAAQVEKKDTSCVPAYLATTVTRRYEVCNYLGLALEGMKRYSDAMSAYESAIEARRSFDTAWANLARLLAKVGRADDARAVLREGRRACPRSKTLRTLAVSDTPAGPDRPTISLCMIVKNEEEHLPRCLGSVKPLVDQIIVVDTGSTDRTVEIAESLGATVYHHAWEGDFSKARNISMGYADCDWILIMDADEELEQEDIPVIRHSVAEADFNVIAVSVYNYSAQKELYTSFLPSNRLVRRDAGAYYDGIVHNQLRTPEDLGSLRIPARIYHYGYGLSPDQMARKSARSMALLEKQLEDNPDHGFAHFNLAQLLRGQTTDDMSALMDRVIHHSSLAVELCRPDDPKVQHIHVMALHQLVTAYLNKGDYSSAETYAHRALEHKPGYLDALLSLGHLHSLSGALDLSRKYYLEYLDRQCAYNEHAETDQVILLHLRSRHNAYYGLGLIALMENNPREAVDWLERCAGEQENYIDVHFRLGFALAQSGDVERAMQEFGRELELHPGNIDAREALAIVSEKSGDRAALQACLNSVIMSGDADTKTLVRAARMDLEDGRPADALAKIGAMAANGEDSDRVALLKGDVFYALERWEDAAVAYSEYLSFHPEDIAAKNNIGNCRFRAGNYAEAEQVYRETIDAGAAEHCVYRNLGVSLAEQNKIDDAIFSMESYLELEPDDAQACGFLGDLYYSQKDFGQAIDQYERLVERDEGRADTLTRLGDCYLNRGAIDSALLGYESALKVDPDYEPAWERLREVRAYLAAMRDGGRKTADAPLEEVGCAD